MCRSRALRSPERARLHSGPCRNGARGIGPGPRDGLGFYWSSQHPSSQGVAMDFEIRDLRTVAQGRSKLVREREEYFRLMSEGMSSQEACRVVGINYRTG